MYRPALLLCAAWLPFSTGCLIVYNKEETIRKAEVRRPVTFESETGYRLFADVVEKQKEKVRHVGSQSLAIPFLACINSTSSLSDAAVYNDEAAVCDRDSNGLISDAEAVAYHKMVIGDSAQAAGGRADKDLLVQHGRLQSTDGNRTVEVKYPRPYLWPPELTFPEMQLSYAKLEQFAHGFRIYFREGVSYQNVTWQTRGVPLPAQSEPVLGARLVQPVVLTPPAN